MSGITVLFKLRDQHGAKPFPGLSSRQTEVAIKLAHIPTYGNLVQINQENYLVMEIKHKITIAVQKKPIHDVGNRTHEVEIILKECNS